MPPSHMAAAFFTTPPPHQLKLKLEADLDEKCQSVGQCILWTGAKDRYGYGYHRFTWIGKRLKLKVHRLAFYLSNHSHIALQPSFHVSHLCHNKLCFAKNHLSYEPGSVNNARKVCVTDGECYGHMGLRRCCLDAVTTPVICLLFVCLYCFRLHV